MELLKTTSEFRADSEEEAKSIMEQYRKEANEFKNYTLGAAGYTYKTKKTGEEAWVVKVVQNYRGVWEE